jgi:MFS family permease
MASNSSYLDRLAQKLALNRTVGIVLVTVLFFGLGEQLWSQFMPVYLRDKAAEAPGTPGQGPVVPWSALLLIGAYACSRNLFEAFCYSSGGQLTARLGDRGSLILIACLTLAGYGLFLASSGPILAVAAALLILGWEPLSVPVTFTTVGSTVTVRQRGMAFALQSIQKRLPKIIGPLIAAYVLSAAERATGSPELGRMVGFRWLVGIACGLGLVSLAIQVAWMPERPPPPPGPSALSIVRGFHPFLRRLLVAEIFTRWCDWLVREFVVIYVILIRGGSVEQVGWLLALQNFTALLTYLPIGRMTATVGLQPFIGLTFFFFALFPLVLAVSWGDVGLVIAFIVYGLREIGEPARKALITTLMPPEVRARGVGLYWSIRSTAMSGASLVGAVIWHQLGPVALLYIASALGAVGTAIYYAYNRRTIAM